MQIYTRLRWRNVMVKSDGSGSNGLTPHACLCYRCCALEFLYQAVDLPTSDFSIFVENEGLVQITVIITSQDFGPDYILHSPKLHGSSPSKYTLYKIFHHSGFMSNMRLPWNFALYIFFLPFRIFEQLCACPEKQSLPWKFSLYWIYFLHSAFLSHLRLPWKTE